MTTLSLPSYENEGNVAADEICWRPAYLGLKKKRENKIINAHSLTLLQIDRSGFNARRYHGLVPQESGFGGWL